MLIFIEWMSKELDTFDLFVDDIISSDNNLLKGELDLLLMQYIFESLDLNNLNNHFESIKEKEYYDSYLVA